MAFSIRREMFTGNISDAGAKEIFSDSVQRVDLEVFTYCNRTCWHCGNATIDRRSKNEFMEAAVYERILDDLAAIDYDKTLSFHRYNEPLADRVILDRLRQAKARLPKATLVANTNGDYLNPAYLAELAEAGLGALRVQAYLGAGKTFDDLQVLTAMTRRLAALGLPFEFVRATPGTAYMAKVDVPGMEVLVQSFNFGTIGIDRGKVVEGVCRVTRDMPCDHPFMTFNIDWNGAVMPCCHLRSDVPEHKDYIVGRIGPDTSIFDLFVNGPLRFWRSQLLTYGAKRAPCDTCAEFPLWFRAEHAQDLERAAQCFGLKGDSGDA